MKRILIIEDNQGIVDLLKLRFESAGYSVSWARDGAAGLAQAKKEIPDLITLDIELPGINGFTICSILKSDERYRNIPIVMLTSRRSKEDRMFFEDYEPDAYVTKPFDAKKLMETVGQLVAC